MRDDLTYSCSHTLSTSMFVLLVCVLQRMDHQSHGWKTCPTDNNNKSISLGDDIQTCIQGWGVISDKKAFNIKKNDHLLHAWYKRCSCIFIICSAATISTLQPTWLLIYVQQHPLLLTRSTTCCARWIPEKRALQCAHDSLWIQRTCHLAANDLFLSLVHFHNGKECFKRGMFWEWWSLAHIHTKGETRCELVKISSLFRCQLIFFDTLHTMSCKYTCITLVHMIVLLYPNMSLPLCLRDLDCKYYYYKALLSLYWSSPMWFDWWSRRKIYLWWSNEIILETPKQDNGASVA